SHPVFLPASEVAEELNDEKASELVNRIEALEKERESLISELSKRATASLDPRSEIANLLTQLQSDDSTTRSKAIKGLAELRDPLSFSALVEFLQARTDEATGIGNPSAERWFTILIESGGAEGTAFVVSQLDSPKKGWAEDAY